MKNQKAMTYMQYLRGTGMSNMEIAKKIKCCYSTVLNYIGTQPVRNQKQYTKGQMLDCRAKGMNNYEIAKELGCCVDTVKKHIGPTPWRKVDILWELPDVLPGMEPEKAETRTEPKNAETGEFIISVKKVG